jgi:hypothetical protein
MLIHSACPHCHHPCIWSDTSDSKYVRCCHCEKTFVISTWGVGQALDQRPRRRRRRSASLWPWVLLTGAACAVIVTGSLFYQGKEAARQESKLSRANFERLKVGMKDLQLFKLLGSPSRRDESIVPQVDPRWKLRYAVSSDEFIQRCFWEDGDDVIWVELFRGQILDYGAILDGERVGKNPQTSLAKELQVLDEP